MRRIVAAVTAVVCMMFCAEPAHAYVDDLDPTFGGDGVVRLGRASSAVIAPGPDGGLFVLTQVFSKTEGTTTTLRRFQADGAVDTTFSGNGSASPVLPGRGEVNTMVMDASGRLVLLGDGRAPFVVRLTASGRVDRTFARDGVRTLVPAESFSRDLALDSRERAVVLTTLFSRTRSSADALVSRLRRDGGWDRGFGVDGVRRIDLQRYDFEAALDTDDQDRPVVGGVGPRPGTLQLVRLTAIQGRLDRSFSDDGVARARFGPVDFEAVTVVRADADVTVGGVVHDGGSQAVAWRVAADGVADLGFGGDGSVRFPVGDGEEHTATVIDDRGAVVASGYATTSRTTTQPLVAALLPDGTPDTGMGPGGRTVLTVGSGRAEAGAGVVIDGKLMVLVKSRTVRGDRRVTIYEVVRFAAAPP